MRLGLGKGPLPIPTSGFITLGVTYATALVASNLIYNRFIPYFQVF
jgi:hypothetical protein